MKHHRSKPTRIEKHLKEIRSLYHEQRKLIEKQRNAPPVELEKPFIRGFERFFVLTPQAKRRGDAEKLALLLEHFQNHECCRKGWFRGSINPKKRWSKGEVGLHYLRRPQLYKLINNSFPKNLYPYVSSSSVDLQNGLPAIKNLSRHQLQQRVKFRFPNLVESHIQPHLITHVRAHDPELEARLDYIDNRLWGGAETAAVSEALNYPKWLEYELPPSEQSARDDFRQQLDEANMDPAIRSAISPRFFCALVVLARAHQWQPPRNYQQP